MLFFLLPFVALAEEPVSLEVLLDGVPQQEGGWVLTVTLHAHVDLDDADLRVIPSSGLRITAGEPRWQGSLPAGGEQIVELSFSLIGPAPREIGIALTGRLKGGGTFEKRLVRKIDQSQK